MDNSTEARMRVKAEVICQVGTPSRRCGRIRARRSRTRLDVSCRLERPKVGSSVLGTTTENGFNDGMQTISSTTVVK